MISSVSLLNSLHSNTMINYSKLQPALNMDAKLQTHDVSELPGSHSLSKENTMSRIIMNYEQFWVEKFHLSKSNDSIVHYLLAQSKNSISQPSSSLIEINENLEIPRNKQRRQKKLEIQQKQEGQQGKKAKNKMKRAKKAKQNSIPQSSFQPADSVQLQNKGEITANIENKTIPYQEKHVEGIRIEQVAQKVKILEELSLLGYWCSLFLSETNIRWQMLCALLYRQCHSRLSDLSCLQSLQFRKWKQINEKVLSNLSGMLSVCFTNRLISKEKLERLQKETSLYRAIVQQSQNFVSDIMKHEVANKKYQLCLYKALNAVLLVGRLNGQCILVDVEQFHPPEVFTIKSLRKSLEKYRMIVNQIIGS